MKVRTLFVGWLFLLLYMPHAYPQIITPEQRQQILNNLNDPTPFVSSSAVEDAAKYAVTEAIPIIEQSIWTQRSGGIAWRLRALDLLNDVNLKTIALALIDSAPGMGWRDGGPAETLAIRVVATEYLYRLGDFSTTRYIFDYLRDTSRVADPGVYQLLKSVITNVPSYADSAKSELLHIAGKATLPLDRWRALNDLVDLYGTEMFPQLVNMVDNDQDPNGSTRLWALQKLFELDYPQLHSLLQDRLIGEAGWPYRTRIADSLLNRYGTPTDFEFVKTYQSKAPEPTEQSLIGKALQAFSPPVPSAALSTSNLLDTLISYIQQCVGIGWIADENFVNELENGLANARKHLMRGDSINCAKEVKTFQDKVNKQYQTTLDNEKKNKPRDKRFVTVEGWKFLFYNAQYILDRLPAPQ